MIKHACFVTGTDTGIGKTFASCAMLEHLAGRGLAVVGMKPVAAGVEEGARVERWPHGVDCNLSRSYAGKGLRRRIGQRRKTVSMCHVTASGAGLSARLSGRPITSPCRA